MPGCTNRADNNSNNNISYSDDVVITISQHIQNPGIFDA